MPGLSEHDVDLLADALHEARRTGVPIDPLTDDRPDLGMTDAYRIQHRLVGRLLDESAADRVVGYKLGLTSEPMQRMLGVDSPDFAPILASQVHPEADPLPVDGFIRPRAEAEIAVMLAEDLHGPDCTPEDVARAVSAARAAIEIVDSRIADWRIQLADTIADLASCGAVVLGETSVPAEGLDLRLVGMVFTRDGSLVATGAGAAALGDPLAAVAWLANTLHTVGASLQAGQFVMTGALHAAVDVAAGQRYLAEFDRLGQVTLALG